MLDRKPGSRAARRRADDARQRPGPGPEAAARSAATRDPERTSAAILAAAIAEFSEKGLGGARIDSIAERAGINKRMLYHYFGDKEALYARALREIYDGIRTAEQALQLDSLDPVAGIRQLATFTWRYFLAHPEFLSMLATENLNRASFLRRTPWASRVNSPLVELLGGILRRGERSGVFRPGLDPVEVYVTMTGIGYFYLSNKHTMTVAFARDFDAPAMRERWGEHMANVVLAWLTEGMEVGGRPAALAPVAPGPEETEERAAKPGRGSRGTPRSEAEGRATGGRPKTAGRGKKTGRSRD